MSMQIICNNGRVWNVNIAKSRENRFQQFIFIINHNEEPRRMTKQFNASSKR